MIDLRPRPEGTPRGPLAVLTLLITLGLTGCMRPTCSGTATFGNLGPAINSPWDDYGPVLPDTTLLIFASNRLDPETTGLRELALEYHPASLYRTHRLSADWDPPIRYDLLRPEERGRELGPTSFPPRGNRQGVLAYSAGCNLPESSLWSGGCDLVMLRGTDGEARLAPVPGTSGPGWEGHPFATPDGRRLYFASDREGGYGGIDIWYIELGSEGSFSEPINAGAVVNTAADEGSPFIDPETGRLYIAAMTEDASWDIFMLEPDLAERHRLPAPFNSDDAEITPWLIAGDLYLASDRPGGCGGFDLYRFAR